MAHKILSFFLIGVCLLLSQLDNAFAKDMNSPQVLVLNSYHKGFAWVDGIVKGVESGLEAEQINYDLRVEYMDSKVTTYDAVYKKKLYELYAIKYANSKFDAIIVSDDHAFDFLREYHKELFPDTPIIFCAVNNSNAPHLIDRNYFTGILETPDQESMINLALKIHPGLKKVYLIADTTPSGNYRWEKQTIPLISEFPNIEFIRIDDSFSFPEIEDQLMNLSDDSISLYAVLTRDKTGRHFSLREAVSRISKASRRPTYTFLSQDLKYGLVGGNVLDGYHQGEQATQIMFRILRGENIAEIPVEENSTSQFMFNYPQLRKFNIKIADLPDESILLNKPLSFYEKHKTILWIAGTCFALLIFVILGLYAHIVKRISLEKALRKSEERFRAIYEHAPVLINAFDKNGNCLLWNNECYNTFGWSIEEIKAHGDALSLFYPDPVIRKKMLSTVTTDPDAQFREWRPLTKDGRILNTMWANFNLPDGLTFSIGYDITERKNAEKETKKLQEKLLQSHKMEAVGTLAGGIAHDFNNILSAILGFTELARDNSSADKQLKDDLDEIRNAGLRAKDLVQQILTFSRKTESTSSPLHVPTIIEEAIKLLRNTLPTSIEFQINIDKTVGPILADPTQIHQIMMNLCTNAGYAMDDEGGTLSIQLSEILPSDSFFKQNMEIGQGKYLKLTIKDTGVGIPPEIMDAIFDPYFTTKQLGDGTGLGLAVTHSLITELGGVIEVKSISGEGTKFDVYFPVAKMDLDSQSITDSSEPLLGGNERILLVDDEAQIRTITSRILTSQGYSVVTASDGQVAFEIFAANPFIFDLIISDVNMPKLSGDKLAFKILEIRPEMSILLASGYNKRISKEFISDIGVKDLLDKPISRDNLLHKVRQVLDKEK